MSLRVFRGLEIPLDAVTKTFAFLAIRGAGKTYGAMVLAEEMLAAEAQIVAIDPIGKWYGLRLKKDGKTPAFPIPLLGGLRGDLPLEPSSGKLVADLIVDQNISAILDVSTMRKNERKRFAADFAEQLFYRRAQDPAATHVFIEEAHKFVPQRFGGGGDEARMVGAFEDIVRLGRNHGLGATLISQRPQSIAKDSLNQTECLVAMQMNGSQERKALREWIVDKKLDVDLVDELPHLDIGEAYVWSPQWLKTWSKTRIRKKKTSDSSATPKVGERRAAPRALKGVELDALKHAMANVVEQAEANDPKKLRARVAELERKLAASDGGMNDAELERHVRAATAEIQQQLSDQLRKTKKADEFIGRLHKLITDFYLDESSIISVPVQTVAPKRVGVTAVSKVPPQKAPPAGLRPAHQKILDGLRSLEAMGFDRVDRPRLAWHVDQSHKSGSFNNYLGALRTAGLINYPESGLVELTDSGRASASEPALETLAEFQSRVLQRVKPAKARVLKTLIDAYPSSMTREELAASAEMSSASGSYNNYLGNLRTGGLITYPSQGEVKAHPMLFREHAE